MLVGAKPAPSQHFVHKRFPVLSVPQESQLLLVVPIPTPEDGDSPFLRSILSAQVDASCTVKGSREPVNCSFSEVFLIIIGTSATL
jgi:hypothetical protein